MASPRIARQLTCRPRPPVPSIPLPRPRLHPIRPVASRYILSSSLSTSAARPRVRPTVFPTEGFQVLPNDQPIQEETTPRTDITFFYPVRQGEIFKDRYQAITKLGYGGCSTIWLAKDLEDDQYVALKVYVHTSKFHRELPFYARLSEVLQKPSAAGHPGAPLVRPLLDSFEVDGPSGGTHPVLVHPPAQMSMFDFDGMFMKFNGFEEDLVKAGIIQVLLGVDFLHTEVEAIHTDIHPGNLLLGTNDPSHFKAMEANELTNPVERKILPDRTIYMSRLMMPEGGPLLLSDFGESRLGPGPHEHGTMPPEYKPPEVLLDMEWSYPVDVWMVGLTAWALLGSTQLFKAQGADGSHSTVAHLAEMTAALGPPPAKFLARSEHALEYWDEDGKWKGKVPIPKERTLEFGASKLNVKDRDGFLAFMRRALVWDPEDRPSARELVVDPWLIGEQEA